MARALFADLIIGAAVLASRFLNPLFGGIFGVVSINLTHLRATFLMYNLFSFIGMIKNVGIIAANYGGGDKI